jgi:hypothetical protein
MTTPNENGENMCPNPQLVEVERKEEKMKEEFQPQETQGKTEKPMNNTQLVIPHREPTPTNDNTITNHYKTGFCQPASLQTTFVQHE